MRNRSAERRLLVPAPPAQRPRSELPPRMNATVEGLRWFQIWFIAALVSGFIAVFGLPGIQDFPPYRIDFDVYRTGGQLALNGGNLYGELPPLMRGDHLPFTYPPIAALLFAVFALLPLAFGSVLITLASLAGLWFSAALVARFTWTLTPLQAVRLTLPVVALGMWLGPVRETLSFGQVNVLLMAAILAGLSAGLAPWKPLPRTPWWGPIVVGFVASIKLTPLVFGLFYLVRRDIRGLIGMLGGVILGTGIGWVFLPANSVEYWSRTLSDTSRIGGLSFASNQGFNGFFHRLFGDTSVSRVLWFIAVAVVIVGIAVIAWRLVSAGCNVEAMLAVAMVSLLASPVSWSHHWVWLVPIIVSLSWWAVPALRPGSPPVVPQVRTFAAAAAIAALAVFFLTPQWWVPRQEGREESWSILQHSLGNCYLWWALLYLVTLAVMSARTSVTQRMTSP